MSQIPTRTYPTFGTAEAALQFASEQQRAGRYESAELIYRIVLAEQPENPVALKGVQWIAKQREKEFGRLSEQIVEAFNRGEYAKAENMARELIKNRPDNALVWKVLGAALMQKGMAQDALMPMQKAVELAPFDAESHNNLGLALKDLGRTAEAISAYRRAIEIEPGYAQAHGNMGVALLETGRNGEAAECFSHAAGLNPGYAANYCNLAIALRNLNRLDEAQAACNKAITLNPLLAEAYTNLGNVQYDQGMLDEALESYCKAIEINPGDAETFYNQVSLKKLKPGDPQFEQMKSLYANKALSEKYRAYICFALGKAYEDIGSIDEAYGFYTEGNRLRKQALGYCIDQDRKLFARIKSAFDSLPHVHPVEPEKAKPVLIVGMPRSGTSLVEQILASHSQVHGAGELNTLDNLARKYFLNEPGTDIGAISIKVCKAYYEQIGNASKGQPWVTDKMPQNFLWIGFLLLASSDIRVIHTRRDPIATCWSNFKLNFPVNALGFSYDLEDLAEYHKLYQDLMAFWHRKFPGRIYDLDYECLTENQEEETRKLLECCGMHWEDACLEFEKTKRAVRTASAAQIRQGMYKGSNEAWKKFDKHLEPLKSGLHGGAQKRHALGTDQAEHARLVASFNRGEYAKAENLSLAAIKSRPEEALGWKVLGAALMQMGRAQDALMPMQKAVELAPFDAESHFNLGIVLRHLECLEEAEKSFRRAIEISPDHAVSHNNLGNLLRERGLLDEAEASLRRAIAARPEYAEAYGNLGNLLVEMGRIGAAEDCLRKSIALRPDQATTYEALGSLLAEDGRSEEAEACFRKAIDLKPDLARAHNGLGNLFKERGILDAAEASIRHAIALDPNYAEAYNDLGNVLRDDGRLKEAAACYQQGIEAKPDLAVCHYNLSLLKTYRDGDLELRLLRNLHQALSKDEDRKYICFALGKAEEDLGEYDASFECYSEGKAIRKRELGYSIEQDRALFENIKSAFSASPAMETVPIKGAKPILIVGMMRSGTSLVEQILASHSKVHGAGELDSLGLLAVKHFLTGRNAGSLAGSCRSIASDYFGELDKLAKGRQYVTDKMPLNFRWLGFLLLANPDIRVVHMIREPMATCWSNFKQYFPAKGLGFTCNLEDIGAYYRLYRDLMVFWHEKFPGRIYDLEYERLTENQEVETRKLLDYCGLSWEDACLEFEKTKRAVRTASAAQVRQGMYKGSNEAWKKFDRHLGPLRAKLE